MKVFDLIRKLKAAKAGNVTVELALVMSVLAVVIVYGVDFSRMAIEKHRLEQFARAGTQYALLGQTEAQFEEGIIDAVEDAAGNDADSLSITPTSYCECPDGTPIDCDDECASGDIPNLFLRVDVSKSYDYLLALSKDLTGDITLSGTSTVRVR